MRKGEIVIIALAIFEMIITLIFGFANVWQDYDLSNKCNDIFKGDKEDD